EVDLNRKGRRWGSAEGMESVEYSCRWNDLGGAATRILCSDVVAFGGRSGARERYEAPKHVHEGARQRQIGPAAVGRHMEEYNQSLAAAFGGHQWRAISQRSPGAVVELGIRLSQHLARNSDIGVGRHSVESAIA